MLLLALEFLVVLLLGLWLARAPRPGPRRAGQALLVLTASAALLVVAHSVEAYLSITPGD